MDLYIKHSDALLLITSKIGSLTVLEKRWKKQNVKFFLMQLSKDLQKLTISKGPSGQK